jgi:hypothetical protein
VTRNIRRAVLAAMVLWSLAFVGYLAVLTAGYVFGDAQCEYPRGSSNYGHASWQWWAPGTRCTYDAAEVRGLPPSWHAQAHVDTPSGLSEVAVVLLLLWPACIAVGARVATRRQSERNLTSQGRTGAA